MNKVAECLHRPDHSRNATFAIDLQLKDIADGIVSRPAELAQQFPIVPEIHPQ